MKSLISRDLSHIKAPGGNLYEWKAAEQTFEVPEEGLYAIAITASAKNASQNNSSDDDDLKVQIGDYLFGKKEIHQGQVSYDGWGTSAAWDGTTLHGEKKTIYFFVYLTKGEQTLKFFADETPTLHFLEVFPYEDASGFSLKDISRGGPIETSEGGIPWMSFVFAGPSPKECRMDVTCQSGKQKGTHDGDNVKVYVNGVIRQNPKAPSSDKYKNFYFSGDQKSGIQTLELLPQDFYTDETSIDLWSDGTPVLKEFHFKVNNLLKIRLKEVKDGIIHPWYILENNSLPLLTLWENYKVSFDIIINKFGSVARHEPLVQEYATQYGIDPDFVMAIMYKEDNTGIYDAVLPYIGAKNETIRPMNVNADIWGFLLDYSRQDIIDSVDKNIELGVKILAEIQKRIEDPTFEKVATLYNNTNATRISMYGKAVEYIRKTQLWKK